jgi:uncharacterized protein
MATLTSPNMDYSNGAGILSSTIYNRTVSIITYEVRDMECPKCHAAMEEITYGRNMTIDRCTNCKGIWFDRGEAEALKDKWMSEFVDNGDPDIGKEYNKIGEVNCPRCSKLMDKVSDAKQPHIWYEVCEDHGMYFDAGEFTDYKYETLLDKFRDLVTGKR